MTIVEKIDKEIGQLETIREIARLFKGTELEDQFILVIDELLLKVTTLAELHTLRGTLRKILGSWSDKFEYCWASGSDGVAKWKAVDYPIVLWLQTPIDKFPKELQGSNCGFKETTTTTYSYVCEK